MTGPARTKLRAGAIMLALIVAAAHADTRFVPLGNLGGVSSTAGGISADGTVVVGASDNGTFEEAYLWTNGIMTPLGHLGGEASRARAISSDLSTVVGGSHNGEREEAFVWRQGTGMLGLGHVGDGGSVAHGVSADGGVVVGTNGAPFASACAFCRPTGGDEEAFVWRADSGIAGLGTVALPVEENGPVSQPFRSYTQIGVGSRAHGVTEDGGTVFGDLVAYFSVFAIRFAFPETIPHAFVWNETDGFQRAIPNDRRSTVVAGTPDAGVLVGDSIYERVDSVLGSSTFLEIRTGIFANDIASDALTIGGYWTHERSAERAAALWRGQAGAVKSYLIDTLDLNVFGWTLTEITGMSDDGRALTGNGINPAGEPEAWLALLDAPPAEVELAAQPTYLFDVLQSAVLPSVRTAQLGQTVTAFVSIANAGNEAALGCRIVLADDLPLVFDYHQTDPVTNATVGEQNTPVDIPAGSVGSFVIGMTPEAAFDGIELTLAYDCINSAPAPISRSINVIRLEAADTPTPDVVALAGTLTNDGIVTTPDPFSRAAFVVAAANVGAAGSITVRPDAGDSEQPLELAICTTDPATGLCLDGPGASATLDMAAQGTASFAVFVRAGGGSTAFNPADERVFVRFTDADGKLRGATSVAVRIGAGQSLPYISVAVVTPSQDGVLRIPGVNESAAFSASMSKNFGPAERVTITLDDNADGLPVDLSLCETDPLGECRAPPAESLDFDFEAGESTFITLAGFATARDDMPLDEARSRIFLRVTKADGSVGAASMAVTTEPQP